MKEMIGRKSILLEQDNKTIEILLDRLSKSDAMMDKAFEVISDVNKAENDRMTKKDKEKWIMFFSVLIFTAFIMTVFILSYFFGTYSTDHKSTNTNINENRNISENK
jgi:CHASE3 domain sensor protein